MADSVLRIAHGYGNRRDRIARALAAGVDLIEADLRWWRGGIWIRHEHRVNNLPVLYNNRLRGIHRAGPWALPVGSWWLRLDVGRLSFAELLRLVSGRAGLMIDLKNDRHTPAEAARFIDATLAELDRHDLPGKVDFCGGWQHLDLVRERRPDQSVHYSIDGLGDWREVERRIRDGEMFPKVTLKRSLITEERVAMLRHAGVPFVAWDIETRTEAEVALSFGAEGLIADDLDLLRSLKGRPLVNPDEPR